MSGPPQPDLNKVISSKCQTFIKQFIESTQLQGKYAFFSSAKTPGTRAYEIVTKIQSIQDVAIASNIDINQKKIQIQKAIIDIEKKINDNLILYNNNNYKEDAAIFVSDLKNLNLDIDAALIPNSTIDLRESVQQQTVPNPVAAAVTAATPITNHTNDALKQLELYKQEVDKLSRELTLLRSQLEEQQTQNTQLDTDNQRLTETNISLLNDKQTISLSLQEKITANEVLSTTVATTESEKLVLSDENKALKKQLSKIQTNWSANNDTISQLHGEISTLKAAALVSGKQFLEKEEAIARLNLQHEGETISLKATLEALKEQLNKQSEKLKITTKENETLQAQSEEYKEKIAPLTEQLAILSAKNVDLERILTNTQQDMKAAQNSATASSDEINKIQQELTAQNADLEAKIAGLQQQIIDQKPQTIPANDQKSKIEELTTANAVLTEQLAQFQAQNRPPIEAAKQLATSLSANMDKVVPLSSFREGLARSIPPIIPDALSELESPPSITLVTPVSPILTTEPINLPVTETPTLPSRLENIAQELETVTPTVSGGGRVVNIEQIQKEGGKETDRPYFDVKNTQQIKLGEEANNPLKTLFDAGTLQFSNQEKPNKITFSNESMDPSDLQAMVAILQATSKDNKEPTLNNVEVILTGKDEDLIQVLQQFHAKLAAAVKGDDDEKICAIKIQDKGGHNRELTYLIKLHNAVADIIHNNIEEGLTADKKDNISEAIKALQEQATQLLESTPGAPLAETPSHLKHK